MIALLQLLIFGHVCNYKIIKDMWRPIVGSEGKIHEYHLCCSKCGRISVKQTF